MSWDYPVVAIVQRSPCSLDNTARNWTSTISLPIPAKSFQKFYEYLGRLEGFLGKPIHRLNADRDFDFWLKQYNNFLPSPQTRWCTRQLKIRPFEEWIKSDLEAGCTVHSYVAIRADEAGRSGMVSKQRNLQVHLPFVEQGLDKAAVIELLEASGLGLPAYYRWRSRSGCTFCFYQQKSSGCV